MTPSVITCYSTRSRAMSQLKAVKKMGRKRKKKLKSRKSKLNNSWLKMRKLRMKTISKSQVLLTKVSFQFNFCFLLYSPVCLFHSLSEQTTQTEECSSSFVAHYWALADRRLQVVPWRKESFRPDSFTLCCKEQLDWGSRHSDQQVQSRHQLVQQDG